MEFGFWCRKTQEEGVRFRKQKTKHFYLNVHTGGKDIDSGKLGHKVLKKGSVSDIIRDTLMGAQRMAQERGSDELEFFRPKIGCKRRRGGLDQGRRAGKSRFQSQLHGGMEKRRHRSQRRVGATGADGLFHKMLVAIQIPLCKLGDDRPRVCNLYSRG